MTETKFAAACPTPRQQGQGMNNTNYKQVLADDQIARIVGEIFPAGFELNILGHRLVSAVERATIEALQASAQDENDELKALCAEAYQVVGVLADDAGRFGDDEHVRKVLDNLSEQRFVHKDVLPFPSKQVSAPTGAPSDADLLWTMRHIEPHLKDVESAIPQLLESARAVLARYGAQDVPDGWRLVPEEPSPEWVSALGEAGVRIGAIEHVIHDVLAAAPQPAATDSTMRDEFPRFYDSLDTLDERAAEQPANSPNRRSREAT